MPELDNGITIFESERCVRCRAVKKAFDKRGLAYTVRPLDDAIRDWAVSDLSMTEAPVVVSRIAGQDDIIFGGYSDTGINRIVEAMSVAA